MGSKKDQQMVMKALKLVIEKVELMKIVMVMMIENSMVVWMD